MHFLLHCEKLFSVEVLRYIEIAKKILILMPEEKLAAPLGEGTAASLAAKYVSPRNKGTVRVTHNHYKIPQSRDLYSIE